MRNFKRIILASITSFAMLLTSLSSVTAIVSNGLKVHFISVGSGDCIYIECNGHNMLIDGGYYSDYHRDTDSNDNHYGNNYNAATDKYFFGSSSEVLPGNTLSDYSISSYIKSDYNNIYNALANYVNDATTASTLTKTASRSLTATDVTNKIDKAYKVTTYTSYTGDLTYDYTAPDQYKEEETITDPNDASKTVTVYNVYKLNKTYTTTYSWTNVDGNDLTDSNNVLTAVPSSTDTNKLSISTKTSLANKDTFNTKVTATYRYNYINTIDKNDNTKIYYDADDSTADIVVPSDTVKNKYDATDATHVKSFAEEFDVTVNPVTSALKSDAELASIKTMLKSNSNACTRYLDSIGVTHIDYIVSSHSHQDHAAGLLSVVSKYSYNHLILPNYKYYSRWASYLYLLGQYNETYAKTDTLSYSLEEIGAQGSSFYVGGAKITVLSNKDDNLNYYLNASHYTENSNQYTGSKLMECALNNTSTILRLDYGYNSFLFTGDAQVLKQNRTINSPVGASLKTQVLDICHHGNSNNDFGTWSNKSGDYAFYGYVAPSIAVAQCGVDHGVYSKPRPKVANDLSMAHIYSTKESGNIVFTSDGYNLSVALQNGQNHGWYVTSKKAASYHKDGYVKYLCDGCGVTRTDTIPGTHKTSKTKTLVASTMTTTGIKANYCACGVLISQTTTSKTTSKTIYKGKTTKLVAGISGKITWTSSKKSVATVSKSGVVKGKKAGSATITMKVNGKKVATCKVTVKNPSLSISRGSVTLNKGKSVYVSASTSPSATISWSSSNKKIATVSKGRIYAKKKGSCKIRVKANGITKTIKVKVK